MGFNIEQTIKLFWKRQLCNMQDFLLNWNELRFWNANSSKVYYGSFWRFVQLIALIRNQLADVTGNETMRFKLTSTEPLTQHIGRFSVSYGLLWHFKSYCRRMAGLTFVTFQKLLSTYGSFFSTRRINKQALASLGWRLIHRQLMEMKCTSSAYSHLVALHHRPLEQVRQP